MKHPKFEPTLGDYQFEAIAAAQSSKVTADRVDVSRYMIWLEDKDPKGHAEVLKQIELIKLKSELAVIDGTITACNDMLNSGNFNSSRVSDFEALKRKNSTKAVKFTSNETKYNHSENLPSRSAKKPSEGCKCIIS